MNNIISQKKNKTFKGYTILYKINPSIENFFHIMEEIRYILDETGAKVKDKVHKIYGCDETGRAIQCLTPPEEELKFYKPGDFLEKRNFYDSERYNLPSIKLEVKKL